MSIFVNWKNTICCTSTSLAPDSFARSSQALFILVACFWYIQHITRCRYLWARQQIYSYEISESKRGKDNNRQNEYCRVKLVAAQLFLGCDSKRQSMEKRWRKREAGGIKEPWFKFGRSYTTLAKKEHPNEKKIIFYYYLIYHLFSRSCAMYVCVCRSVMLFDVKKICALFIREKKHQQRQQMLSTSPFWSSLLFVCKVFRIFLCIPCYKPRLSVMLWHCCKRIRE